MMLNVPKSKAGGGVYAFARVAWVSCGFFSRVFKLRSRYALGPQVHNRVVIYSIGGRRKTKRCDSWPTVFFFFFFSENEDDANATREATRFERQSKKSNGRRMARF